MVILRRLQLLLSCLLAVLLVSGSALPPAALWQCRHAARVVDAAFVALPSAMPCSRGGRMPPMACCPPEKVVVRWGSSLTCKPALLCAPCQPTLTRLAALPAASITETNARLRLSLASLPPAFPLPAAFLPSAPIILSLRQRPPPTLGQSQSAPEHAPGLRAPPVA